MGDSVAEKGSEGRQIERINFKPREKVVFKQKETNKEMLFGSAIWFKPKDGEGKEELILYIDIIIYFSRK